MRVLSALMLSSFALPLGFAADLLPETKRAFDRYAQLTEAQLDRTLNGRHFLYSDLSPSDKAKLRKGEVTIMPREVLDNAKEIDVPGGLVQDWVGVLFIPNATVEQVRAVLEDYAAYKNLYKPEVIESKLLNRNGNEFDIFLRLYKKQFLTVVVLNANYHVTFGQLDPTHLYVNSRSTRIAEVDNPDRSMTAEQPVGHDDGFLWALNSYWRIEQADGGVYLQLEAVSLSRDLPFGLFWLKGFLQKFPKDSMEATLRGTKRGVKNQLRAGGYDLGHLIPVPALKNL